MIYSPSTSVFFHLTPMMRRTLPLLVALGSAVAIPLASAESWTQINVNSQTWDNGVMSAYSVNVGTPGAAQFSMPAMPAMPAMPNMVMPPMPNMPQMPAMPNMPAMPKLTMPQMPQMPSLGTLPAALVTGSSAPANPALTMGAKMRACRQAYVIKVPVNVQLPTGAVTRMRTQVDHMALRNCMLTAAGMSGGNWSWPSSMSSVSSQSSSRSSSMSSSSPSSASSGASSASSMSSSSVSSASTSSSSVSSNNSASTSRSSSASSQSSQAVQAVISNFAFQPAVLQIKKGTTVTWTNQDTAPHTVTGDFSGPASGLLQKGQTYSYTFNTMGAFPYHCIPHPGMRGTVIVTQ